jgi:hypothetical protein
MSALVIDADGHVTEPPILWDTYLEPRWRDRAPRFALDPDGRPCAMADGRLIMRHALRLTLPAGYPEAPYAPRPGGSTRASDCATSTAKGSTSRSSSRRSGSTQAT